MSIEGQTDAMKIDNTKTDLKSVIVGIRKWYWFFKSKWVVIVSFCLLGAFIGYAYSYLNKPLYTAKTVFVLEEGESAGGLGQYAGLASMVGLDLGGGGGGIFQGDNILELYKSRTMIEKALLSPLQNDTSKLLIDAYISFNNIKEEWKLSDEDLKFDKKDRISFTRLQDSIIGKIVDDINKNNLVVSKPDKKLTIVNVVVKAKDENFAKNFNDQIVDNVNEFYVQTKTKKSLQNISILQQKTDSVRAVMNGAIYSAASVMDATPNLNPSRQIQRAPIQRSQFNAETNKAILGELVKNLELSKISFRKEMPLIQIIDQPILPLHKEKVGMLKGVVVGVFVFLILCLVMLVMRRVLKVLDI